MGKFKELTESSNQKAIDAAISSLPLLMSKRLARLFKFRAKRKAERSLKLIEFSKEDKIMFVKKYNFVVQLREQRMEKLKKAFLIFIEIAKKAPGIKTFDDAFDEVKDVFEEK